jgi:hypothetical protein
MVGVGTASEQAAGGLVTITHIRWFVVDGRLCGHDQRSRVAATWFGHGIVAGQPGDFGDVA